MHVGVLYILGVRRSFQEPFKNFPRSFQQGASQPGTFVDNFVPQDFLCKQEVRRARAQHGLSPSANPIDAARVTKHVPWDGVGIDCFPLPREDRGRRKRETRSCLETCSRQADRPPLDTPPRLKNATPARKGYTEDVCIFYAAVLVRTYIGMMHLVFFC